MLKADSDSLDPYLRECVQFYTRPCKIVRNRLLGYGNKSKLVNSVPLTSDSSRDGSSYNSPTTIYNSPNRSILMPKNGDGGQRFSQVPNNQQQQQVFGRLSGDSGKTHEDELSAKLDATSKKELTLASVDSGNGSNFKTSDYVSSFLTV